MPDIGIATIEVCLKALQELPYEDALAALAYLNQRIQIKENRRRIIEAQKQKLGREPTDEEARNALDEWDSNEAEKNAASTAAYPAGASLGLPPPVTPTAYMKRAI
jgi:ribosomal 50S subunit-associated protein YjgA (DUF615 family)